MRAVAAAIVAATVAAGCSVSVPRHGEVALRTRGATTEAGGPSSEAGATPMSQAPQDDVRGMAASAPRGQARRAATNAAPHGDGGEPAGRAATARGVAPPAVNRTGIGRDTITVSVLASFNGPFAPFAEAVYPGFQTWVDDVNARGGIFGRRVVVRRVGHGDTDDGAIAACKQVVSNGSFVAVWVEGMKMDPGIDCLDRAGIPSLTIEAFEESYSKWRRSYVVTATPDGIGHALPSMIRNVFHDGAKPIGTIFTKGGAFQELNNEFVAAARTEGLNVVGQEAVELSQGSFVSQLLRLRNKGVQNLAMFTAFETIGIFRDAQAIRYRPHFTGYGLSIDTITQACQCEYANGAIALRPWTTVDTPAFVAFRKKMQDFGRGAQADGNTLYLYGQALVLERVLRAAGPFPSRESLLAGIESITSYDNAVVPPISWAPGQVVGSDAVFPVTCCDAAKNWMSRGPARARF